METKGRFSPPHRSTLTPPIVPSHDDLPVAVATIDGALRILTTNDAWSYMVRAAPDRESWSAPAHPSEHQRTRQRLETAIEHDRALTFVVRGRGPDQWLEIRAAPGPPPAALIVVAIDVSEQKRREALLALDASLDPLTGLFNRRTILEQIPRALARLDRGSSFLGVFYIDLDRFKTVNDRHGHTIGDRVLVAIAEHLQQTVRRSDTVARVGGDEFVAVCEGLRSPHEALALAERLAADAAEPVPVPQSEAIRVTASVGVATTDDPNESMAALLDRADRAMYEARRRGISALQADTTRRRRTAPGPESKPAAPMERTVELDH